jgi:hypothetical protein
MGLSCCRPRGTNGRENPAAVIWEKIGGGNLG